GSFGSQAVTINVGGLRFALPWEALADVPISRLGRLRLCSSHDDVLALCDDYDIACNEFFFDRSPCAFRAVLAFLRAGKLHLQPDSCSLSFRDELHYWGVCEEYLEPCCLRALQQRADEDAAAEAQDTYQDTSAAAVEGATSGFIRALRDIVERPQSGLAGKVFACLSVTFVVITVVSLCVGTMPDMREEERKVNSGTVGSWFSPGMAPTPFGISLTVCVAWFSLELTLRFIQAPDKCQFARSPLNMIDVIAILPYYVSLIIDAFSTSDRNFYLEKVGLVLRVLRALRMMYVMRLARHSLGLQTLGLTMRRCTHEFGLLLLFLCVALSLFAPLAFLIEKEVGNHANFTSIPASYWWAVISMTTVGYGDMVPHSFPGQLVALCGILSGILLMAFPVTSIFHSFSHSYLAVSLSAHFPVLCIMLYII
uniref:Potassium voltage-gated channel, subfamily G, member 2 n=1 Tax=Eptatretus burgeri TaxID=7764 RepID=A0A8C4PWL8_EPTBU